MQLEKNKFLTKRKKRKQEIGFGGKKPPIRTDEDLLLYTSLRQLLPDLLSPRIIICHFPTRVAIPLHRIILQEC